MEAISRIFPQQYYFESLAAMHIYRPTSHRQSLTHIPHTCMHACMHACMTLPVCCECESPPRDTFASAPDSHSISLPQQTDDDDDDSSSRTFGYGQVGSCLRLAGGECKKRRMESTRVSNLGCQDRSASRTCIYSMNLGRDK